MSKRLLLIDSTNQFLRAYIVDPSLSANGDPIGGVKGYLKILQKTLREINPDFVVMVWDGPGGSRKRISIVKEYKAGRKPIKLNRNFDLSEHQEAENRAWQHTRCVEYINNFPVIQFAEPDVEADDIISYIARHNTFSGWEKVIMSSDKDFIQLCDKETVLYRPTQKEVLSEKAILERFGIHPNNFALARAIDGDKSDNLKGVPGAGLATIAKRLPFLKEEKDCTIDDVFSYSEKHRDEFKFYSNLIDNKKLVKTNYKIMQLYSPIISLHTIKKVNNTISNSKMMLNRTGVVKMMIEDGFGEGNWDDLFRHMKKIVISNK
jgi:5'-3' exonuclease